MYQKPKDALIIDKIPSSLKGKPIREGLYGKCYQTKSGKQVFKKFHKNNQLSKDNIYNLKAFTYIENDYFAFPKTLVYKDYMDDNQLIGYLMNYIDGIIFRLISDKERMKDILNASYIIENQIYYLSNNGVIIHDIHDENVLYTKDNLFKVIDTDLYEIHISEDTQIILKQNLKEWGNFLISMLGHAFPYNNKRLNDLYLQLIMEGRTRASKVLELILKEIKKELNYEVETIGDYKLSLDLMKKY